MKWKKFGSEAFRLVRRIVDAGALIAIVWMILCATIVVRTGSVVGIDSIGLATAELVRALIVEPIEALSGVISRR